MPDVAPGHGDTPVNQIIFLQQEPVFNLLYIIQTMGLISHRVFILPPYLPPSSHKSCGHYLAAFHSLLLTDKAIHFPPLLCIQKALSKITIYSPIPKTFIKHGLCAKSCSRYWKCGNTVVNKENKILHFIHRESQ